MYFFLYILATTVDWTRQLRTSCVVARQFCQLTRDGEVYHEYCLNYSKAMTYLERLRKNEDFCEFEKVRTITRIIRIRRTMYRGFPNSANFPGGRISGFRRELGSQTGRRKLLGY